MLNKGSSDDDNDQTLSGTASSFLQTLRLGNDDLHRIRDAKQNISIDAIKARFPNWPTQAGEAFSELPKEMTALQCAEQFGVVAARFDIGIIGIRFASSVTGDPKRFAVFPFFQNDDKTKPAFRITSFLASVPSTELYKPGGKVAMRTEGDVICTLHLEGEAIVIYEGNTVVGTVAYFWGAVPYLSHLYSDLFKRSTLLVAQNNISQSELRRQNSSLELQIEALKRTAQLNQAAAAPAASAGGNSAELQRRLTQCEAELAAARQQIIAVQEAGNSALVPFQQQRQQQQQQNQSQPRRDYREEILERHMILRQTNLVHDFKIRFASVSLHQAAFVEAATHAEFITFFMSAVQQQTGPGRSPMQQQMLEIFSRWDGLACSLARFISPDEWAKSPLAMLGNAIMQPLTCLVSKLDLGSLRTQVLRATTNSDDDDDTPEVVAAKEYANAVSKTTSNAANRNRDRDGKPKKPRGKRGSGKGSRSPSNDKKDGGKNAGGGRQH
jgi:hypothetical protein